jgi:hypothetical protein
VGAEADLEKAGQSVVFALRDEDGHGESAVFAGSQDGFQFPAMFFRRGIGPQEMACRTLIDMGSFLMAEFRFAIVWIGRSLCRGGSSGLWRGL